MKITTVDGTPIQFTETRKSVGMENSETDGRTLLTEPNVILV